MAVVSGVAPASDHSLKSWVLKIGELRGMTLLTNILKLEEGEIDFTHFFRAVLVGADWRIREIRRAAKCHLPRPPNRPTGIRLLFTSKP